MEKNQYWSDNHTRKYLKLQSVLGINDQCSVGIEGLGCTCEGWGGTGRRFRNGLSLGYDLLTGSSRMSGLEGDRMVALETITKNYKVMCVSMCVFIKFKWKKQSQESYFSCKGLWAMRFCIFLQVRQLWALLGDFIT